MLSIAMNIVVQAFGKLEHLLINYFTKKSKEEKEREEEEKKKITENGTKAIRGVISEDLITP